MLKTTLSVLLVVLGMTGTFAQELNEWRSGYFVDEFGDKTEDPFVAAMFEGTFSNSATTNSGLIAVVRFENDSDGDLIVGFLMAEYKNRPFAEMESCIIKIKLPDGGIKEFPSNSGRYLWGTDALRVAQIILDESKPIKVFIEDTSKYGSSSYRFTINPLGFSEQFEKLK